MHKKPKKINANTKVEVKVWDLVRHWFSRVVCGCFSAWMCTWWSPAQRLAWTWNVGFAVNVDSEITTTVFCFFSASSMISLFLYDCWMLVENRVSRKKALFCDSDEMTLKADRSSLSCVKGKLKIDRCLCLYYSTEGSFRFFFWIFSCEKKQQLISLIVFLLICAVIEAEELETALVHRC